MQEVHVLWMERLLMRVRKVHMGSRHIPDPEMRAQGYPYAVKSVPVLHDNIVNHKDYYYDTYRFTLEQAG